MPATDLTREIYLIMSSSGGLRAARELPVLRHNEIAIRLTVNVPMRIFERPRVHAFVKVSESAIAPTEISPEVLINTAELIEQRTKMQVRFIVSPPREADKEELK